MEGRIPEQKPVLKRSMFFKKKKKRTTEKEETLSIQQQMEKTDVRYEVIAQCEQAIDASKEIEDIRREYELVSAYLSDIEVIENLPEDERNTIRETAGNILQLNSVRNEIMETDHVISDAQFALMEEQGDAIPDAIKRLQANEAYLDTVKRDLNYLEGEKTELDYHKRFCRKRMKQLRHLAFVLLTIFVLIIVLLLILQIAFRMEMQTGMLLAAFLATGSGVFTLIRYQDYGSEIKTADRKINRAISLENRVKIKYVNIKNAVDYVYAKYQVKNSYEFLYIWEKYNEAVKKREKQKQTDDDLEYFENKLVRLLRFHDLYDARVWTNHANALYHKKDMVEVKHNLLIRRQKLRSRIEYNVDMIRKLKTEIEQNIKKMPAGGDQIKEILSRLDHMDVMEELS